MIEPLSEGELGALRALNTPTVANAIEKFGVRARHVGFTGPEIRCMFPEMAPIVGYAATAKIAAEQPNAGGTPSRHDYWDSILKVAAPRVAVVQDMDQPRAIGSFWGEVNANIHRALGCLGTITNGGVRDLDEVRALGFQMLASAAIVSHAYVHLIEWGTPVKLGGLWVSPGDLIHADQHGAIVIPHEIAREVPAAAEEVEQMERRIINYCKSPEFRVDGLKELTG